MPSLLLRKQKKPEKEAEKEPEKEYVTKVLKESVEILDTKSTSGHMLTKSAYLTGLALANSAKFTLLKGPLALDYLCVACLSILFYNYYGIFFN